MERVLIGLLVLGFMLMTMLVSARLAVRGPRTARQDPGPTNEDPPTRTGSNSAEFVGRVDSVLRSALD